MSKEKIWARLRTIMTEEECGRIEIFETIFEGNPIVKDTETALIVMLSTEVISGRERAKIRPFMNPGITQIEFAAA